MEKDFGFGFHYPGWSNFERPFRNPHSIQDSMLRSSPAFPVLNSALRQQNDTKHHGKRFLVFDRSGDKTTLIQLGGCYRIADPRTSKEELTGSVKSLRPSLAEENVEEDSSRDSEEDSEELNALLWSDDETDDNEEASTGHSPSTMTDNRARDLAEEAGEEVDSIIRAAKRQKLAATTFSSSALEDDAEEESRKEKSIDETVSILQRIIPDANGKSAVMVIDEAISYLQSLQAKAVALG